MRDAINDVGYDIGRTTIQRILAEHGIAPAPQRKREYSWATFIKAHLGAIAGMDFFTVEVLTVVGLVWYHVLFVIDIGSRIVEVVGLARDPGSVWMKQMARNLLDADDGFLWGKRYLILGQRGAPAVLDHRLTRTVQAQCRLVKKSYMATLAKQGQPCMLPSVRL